MRKETLLRFGFASLLLGGSMGAMFAVGCGGDDTNGGPTGAHDSGPDSTTPIGDDGSSPPPGDSGTDADAAPAPKLAKLLLVHASPDAPPVRLCIGFGDPSDGGAAVIQPLPPTPNTVMGLPPGFGGPSAKPQTDLASKTLTVYAIVSTAITDVQPTDAGTEKTCKDLLGSTLTDGVTADAGPTPIKLGTIPSGTLVDGSSWVLAVVGCLPGNAGGATVCGTGYDSAKGNIRILSWRVDNTTAVASNAVGAQFIQASSPYEGIVGETLNNVTVASGFYSPAPPSDAGTGAADSGLLDSGLLVLDASLLDAGLNLLDSGAPAPQSTISLIETSAKFGSLAPATLASVQGLTFDGTSGFLSVPFTDGGAVFSGKVAYPLPIIQNLSWPTGTPPSAAFANGKGYAFILVGSPDPSTSPQYVNPVDGGPSSPDGGGVFNGRSIHFLAFPTDPPTP